MINFALADGQIGFRSSTCFLFFNWQRFRFFAY